MFADPLLLSVPDSAVPRPEFGFRTGTVGTHTSRTMMLEDASVLFSVAPVKATRTEYRDAILTDNCLGKRTLSTRRASDQRLSELYALDPRVALFRVMRALWENDERGRPLLALLLSIARDPLLRFSATP